MRLGVRALLVVNGLYSFHSNARRSQQYDVGALRDLLLYPFYEGLKFCVCVRVALFGRHMVALLS